MAEGKKKKKNENTTVVSTKRSKTGTDKSVTRSKVTYNAAGKPIFATSSVKGYDYESGNKFSKAAPTSLGSGKYMPKGGVVGPKTAKLTPAAKAKALKDAEWRRK
jgi:hypothetical protein